MVPWSITGVTGLPSIAKLGGMQQNTHGLVQLITVATPDVPNEPQCPELLQVSVDLRCRAMFCMCDVFVSLCVIMLVFPYHAEL